MARSTRFIILIGALGWGVARLAAQAPGMPQPDNGPNLPAQPIGPNDLLAVSVYGAPELTRSVRVSDDGLIRLPMLREKIAARGLMPSELESKIAAALTAEDLLVDPVVSVSISEYHSHPVSVAGAVKSPLTFQAIGKTTLLEALTRAQGLSEDAGPEILVTRPSAGAQPPLIERIPVRGLIDGADPSLNIPIEGGEEIRVPSIGRVFVVGNVKRPGAFRIEDGSGLTVLKALAMAEGLAPYATKQAYIYRRDDAARGAKPAPDAGGLSASIASQPADLQAARGTAANRDAARELPVELRKIMDRKAADVRLIAGDILYVPDNRSGRATMNALEKAVGFATATASGALILGVGH